MISKCISLIFLKYLQKTLVFIILWLGLISCQKPEFQNTQASESTQKENEHSNTTQVVLQNTGLPPYLLPTGRVTSFSFTFDNITPNILCIGHEDGWVSLWTLATPSPIDNSMNRSNTINSQLSPTPYLSKDDAHSLSQTKSQIWRLKDSWLAHQEAVRMLDCKTGWLSKSAGADGTWSQWSSNSHLIKRVRAIGFRLNDVVYYANRSYIAADRGIIVAMENNKELWRTAGVHGRATFSIMMHTSDHNIPSKRLISLGSDGYIRQWLTENGEYIGGWKAHQGWGTDLRSIKLDPTQASSQIWISAGTDGRLCLWPHISLTVKQDQNVKPLDCLQAHKDDLTRISVQRIHNRIWVASADEGGSILLSEIVSTTQSKISLKLRMSWQLIERSPVLALSFNQNALYISARIKESEIWYADINQALFEAIDQGKTSIIKPLRAVSLHLPK
jgi:hypothetical protein